MDFMQHALEIAARARGTCKPNPAVGALVVRDGRVIGEGATQPAGSAHAEIVALDQAGELARGAVLYVTLEPCSHHGRTAPCVEAVIGAGISEVHVAMIDPSPWVAGQGLQALQASGLHVVIGERADEARVLNLPYFTWAERGRPYATGLYGREPGGRAVSLDWRAVRDTSPDAGSIPPSEPDVVIVDQAWRHVDLGREWSIRDDDDMRAGSSPPRVMAVALTDKGSAEASIGTWRDLLGRLAGRGVQHVALHAAPATLEALREAGLVDRVCAEPVAESADGMPLDEGARDRFPVQDAEEAASKVGRFACSPGS